MAEKAPKLLDQVREILRMKHYAYRTEQAYIYWIKRFVFFHNKRHPKDMAADEVGAFIAYLALRAALVRTVGYASRPAPQPGPHS